jgi:hypothetical protein
MINPTYWGGELALSVRGSLFQGEFELELLFAFSLVSLAFCLLVVLHVVLNSKFKLCAFVLSMYSSRWRLINQVVSTLVRFVMSN